MKRLGLATALSALLAITALPSYASPAALPPGYLGIQYSLYEHEPEALLTHLNKGSSFDVNELTLRLGGRITSYFSSELRVSGLRETWDEQGQSLRYDYQGGAYLRAHLPIYFIEPYVLAGYTLGRRSITYPLTETGLQLGELVSERETLQSYSLGAGVDLNLGSHLAVSLEYLQPYIGEDMAPEVVSLGFMVRF